MKAAQLDRYAKDGRLVVREVPDPEPAANEVLIEVRAAAVNPLELLIASGKYQADSGLPPAADTRQRVFGCRGECRQPSP